MASAESTDDPVGEKIESAIVLASPLFDLVLSVGERISRIAEPVDYEHYPLREPENGESTAD